MCMWLQRSLSVLKKWNSLGLLNCLLLIASKCVHNYLCYTVSLVDGHVVYLYIAQSMDSTVLSGAEERGVQRRSLAPYLIFSIPAELRSYLRTMWRPSMQYKAHGLYIFCL